MSILAGKAVTLALFALPLTACDQGLPFGGGGSSTIAESAVSDRQVRAFYAAREWKSAWDGASEKALREIIGNALAHGLKPSLFLEEDKLPEDQAARDQALTGAALKYASALADGYSDPKKLNEIYTLPRPKTDLAAGLAKAVDGGDLQAFFDGLAPQTDEYRALSQAHVRLFEQAARAQPTPVPAGKAIKPRQRDQRLPAIASALAFNGYLESGPGDLATPQDNSGIILDGIKRLQADFGMEADGVIGEATLEALNAGPAGRARQVAVALERLRWLDREERPTRIDVNTAAAFLGYWRDGKRVDRRNVVVGEPGWETPQLASPMFQLVAKPMWRVPDSILEDELAGKSSAWLAANNFQTRDGRLVQGSGPKNSLGLVKFDLKNDHAIYLHDTPAKALFTQPERHRSHGCVRVHNATQFASLIAAHEGVLNQFHEAMTGDDETYVKLKQEIPVRLLYHTAFLDGGRIHFRPDPYGWDDNVAVALGFKRGPIRKAGAHKAGDVGP